MHVPTHAQRCLDVCDKQYVPMKVFSRYTFLLIVSQVFVWLVWLLSKYKNSFFLFLLRFTLLILDLSSNLHYFLLLTQICLQRSQSYQLLIIVHLKRGWDHICSLVVQVLPCSGYFITPMVSHFRLDNAICLGPFPGSQGSCDIVPNGPAGSVVTSRIELLAHIASTKPTLT